MVPTLNALFQALQRRLMERPRAVVVTLVGLGLASLLLVVLFEAPLLGAGEVAEDPALELGLEEVEGAGLTDADGDGLPDVVENYVTGTNHTVWDTSGDGVPDGWLWRHNASPADPNASLAWAAYPGPGEAPAVYGPEGLPPEYRLTYREAYLHERPGDWNESRDGPNPNALDPTVWRAPNGLPVSWLVHHGLALDQDPDVVVSASVVNLSTTNASATSTPGGLDASQRFTVREAYEAGTDPRRYDSDDDGLADVDEGPVYGTDPSRASTSGSGIPDGWLVLYGLDLFNATVAFADPDNDGLTNREEYLVSEELVGRAAALADVGQGLSPHELSSGGSGLPDGWLVAKGLDPIDPDVGGRIVDRSANHDLAPGGEDGEEPPEELALPETNLTVSDAYAYDRPAWWREDVNGVWWGGLDPTGGDTDHDGLPDVIELRGWHIHENRTGQDGVWVRVDADPRKADTDADGLSDHEEFLGTAEVETDKGARSFPPTDPRKEDSDFDGLRDGFEALTSLAEGDEGSKGLNPMDPDTDDDGLNDGPEWQVWEARSQRYARTGTYEFNGTHAQVTDWLQNLTWVRERGTAVDRALASDLFAPGGDLDGDGEVNILDRDADGDGLDDGWEVDPTLYRDSPFASPFPRTVTDPGNPDTDGDTLPDAWEVEYGVYDPELGGWNLDPAAWSSLRDGTSDADQDLDADGTIWYTYDQAARGLARTTHEFEGTNAREFTYGTDPNEPDTDRDELPDGWEILWGAIYPGLGPAELGNVYPGAPGPLRLPVGAIVPDPIGETDGVTTVTSVFPYQRVSKSSTPIEAWGESAGASVTFSTAKGGQMTTYRFSGRIEYTLADHFDHATNPYLEDGDGDGMPDAWELLANLNAPPGEALDPASWDATGDPDGDGLSNVEEYIEGTDPFRADTDFGGVTDGRETRLSSGSLDPLNGADDRSLFNSDVDTDGDGLSDARELFETGTNMTNVDTDHDGLVDGPDLRFDPRSTQGREQVETLRSMGVALVERADEVTALGEEDAGTDPTTWDTDGDGVPDGWQALHPSADPAFYAHCRPSQWDEAVMGAWRWGLDPGTPDHRLQAPPADLDRDGLRDLLGEDPYPCATPEASPPLGVPWADGLTPDQRLERARNYGLDLGGGGSGGGDGDLDTRDAGQANGIPDVRDRARTRMVIEAVDGQPYDGQGIALVKGLPMQIEGRLLVDERDARGNLLNPPGTPVPSATVVAAVNAMENVFGAGFTAPDGRFNFTFNLVPNHEVEIPAAGMVAMGADRGAVSWTSQPDAVETGTTTGSQPNVLLLQSYNTSASVEPGHPTFYRFSARLADESGRERVVETHGVAATRGEAIPLDVVSGASLALQVPESVGNGGILTGWLTLEDDRSRPLPSRTVSIGWDGATSQPVTTTGNGSAAFELPVTVDELGVHEVTARFEGDPDGSVHGGFASERVLVKNTPLLHASASPREPAAGDQLSVRGTLLDGSRPLPNQTITIQGPVRATLVTDATGRFARTLEVPEGTEPGPARLTVSFPGSQTHNPVDQVLDVTMLVPTTLEVEAPASLERGATLAVRGALLDAGGRPLAERAIELHLDGSEMGSVSTGERGRYELRVPVPPTAAPGPQRVEVQFAGGALHLPSSNATHLLVTAGTEIDVEETLGIRGGDLLVAGRLLLEDGNPAAHRGLALAWQGTWLVQDVTDQAGRFRLQASLPPEVPLGPTSVRVAFNGSQDGSLRPSSLSLTIPVREAVVLELDQPSLQRGTNDWAGTLSGSDGRPLAGQGVTLHLDGGLTALAETDDQGRFELHFSLPEDAPLADHTVDVRFQGTGTLGPAERTLDLPVLTDAHLELTPPLRLVVGERTGITGSIVDSAGAPVEGGTVTALLGERTVDTSKVEAGAFTLELEIPAGTPLGSSELAVRYTGTRHVLPTEARSSIDLVAPVTMDVDLPSEIEPGQVLQAVVQLATAAGDPLANAPVFFQPSEDALVRVVYTDERGRAEIPVHTDEGGKLTYRVWYPGTESLSPASAQAQTNAAFPLAGAGLPLAVLAVVLVGVGIAAALIARHWRARTREIVTVLDEALDALLTIEDRVRAIELAYQRFEKIARIGGVDATASTTPREVADRFTAILPVASEAAHRVATTFERALFSARPPTEADREAIIESLRRVRDEVRLLMRDGADPPERDQIGEVPA